MIRKLSPLFRNFYVLATLIFLFWMLVLDSNNFIARYELSSKRAALEDEKEYYQQKIVEVRKDRDELFGDRESIEKFAREKYLMKKETEDIFIIQEK